MLRNFLPKGFMALIAATALIGAARGEPGWAETLSARVLNAGAGVRLPPHLSAALGLTGNEAPGLAVRQLAARDGHTVRTFNVGVEAPHRVVVIVVDEVAQLSVAYLLTQRGHLRKAVEYHSGEQPRELSASEARSGFEAEMQFWSSQTAAGAARRP